MEDAASIKRLKLSKFKLNALLEVTQAINSNLTPEELIALTKKILVEDLNIGKILIFKQNEKWECILQSGCTEKEYSALDVERDLIPVKDISFVTVTENRALDGFDIIIPVYHNNQPLAFVIIGDIEEGEGVSPVIKHLNFIQTLTNIVVVAIENIRLFQESLEQERLKKELELARKMQSLLIPDNDKLPQNFCVEVTGFYQPHYSIGGDYYDCIRLSHNTYGFCIADVSGKGISAALLMANFQANLRALYTHEIALEELVETLNQRVIENAHGEKFITLFIAKYHCDTGVLEYVNAAHNPPVLYKTKSGKVIKLPSNTVGVGMLDEMPAINKETLTLHERTKMICYTDGLSELPDEEGNEIGTVYIEKDIANDKSIAENLGKLISDEDINPENQRLFDDVSILGIDMKQEN
ncbi:MAG: SpoIIE family protein phosphatase [Chlorobi bacterium]|nr:SpoIIE family protein phosphatase [Chlorobiota bacterium]